MTDTTKKPITLDQVHDDIKLAYYGAPDELTDAIVPLRKLLVWKHSINAQLTAQREGEAVAEVIESGLDDENNTLMFNRDKVDALPVGTKLYTVSHRPRAAVTVTDEMVKSFEDMYKKVDTYPGFVGLRKSAVRVALEAILKGK